MLVVKQLVAVSVILGATWSICFPVVQASEGDRYWIFQKCVDVCHRGNCTDLNGIVRQPEGYLKFLEWDCESECKYDCMWKTVEAIQHMQKQQTEAERPIEIPQFYGKWPFKRFLGMQEPASVFFSFLNLLGHLWGLVHIRARVPSTAPLYWFWHVFAAVCVNGWIWSIIFHTRDTELTELMDYFSAFAMVLFSFFACVVRYFEKPFCTPVLIVGAALAALCVYHVHYLAFIHFDYGYNMKANVAVGVLNASFWLVWSGMNRKTHPHVTKCVAFVLLAVVFMATELYDFAPWWWVLDAHAIWHMLTAPITPIWYLFLKEDMNFLHMKSLKFDKLP